MSKYTKYKTAYRPFYHTNSFKHNLLPDKLVLEPKQRLTQQPQEPMFSEFQEGEKKYNDVLNRAKKIVILATCRP